MNSNTRRSFLDHGYDALHRAAMIHAIVTSLILMFPSGPHQQCIRDRAPQIERHVQRALRAHPSVSASSLIAIGFVETHLGCVRGIGWGARPLRRDRGNPAMAAARSLERGLRICGDQAGSFRFFRTGKCRPSDVGSSYAHRAQRLASRLSLAAIARRDSTRRPQRHQ